MVKFRVLEVSFLHVLVEDMSKDYNCMSITNAAESVVERLWQKGYLDNEQKLFYIDSGGIIDEIIYQAPHTVLQFAAGNNRHLVYKDSNLLKEPVVL